jgi:Fic family protein
MQTNHWIWQHRDWPAFSYDAGVLLADVGAVSRLAGRLEAISCALNDVEHVSVQEQVLTDDAMETSAIEGQILRRSSVRASIRRRLGLPEDAPDRDTQADGLVAMLLDARNNPGPPLTEERLCAWHAALFPSGHSGLTKIRVGRYRGEEEIQIVSGPFGKETIHYIAPPHKNLSLEMERFLDWVNSSNEQELLIKAGIAHLWFIMIHPFDDGNGRIGRAISDFQLAGSFPAVMRLASLSKHISGDRKRYYHLLEVAGKNGLDITAWLQLFLQALKAAISEAEWIVERVARKAEFWQHHRDNSLNARQHKVINRLLDAGERFEGGMTTRKYAGMTKCSKVTASRDLSDLVGKNILKKCPGKGRSTSYELSGTKGFMDDSPMSLT